MYFEVWVCNVAAKRHVTCEGGCIKALAGLVPLAKQQVPQREPHYQQIGLEKFSNKCVRQIRFNGKMDSITFYQMHLAKLEKFDKVRFLQNGKSCHFYNCLRAC